MPHTIGIAFMAAPVLLGLVLLFIWRIHRRVHRTIATAPAGWQTVPGSVVDERTRYDRDGLSFDHGSVFVRTPIVRFTAADGRDVTARSQVEGTWMPRPGHAVVVHYDPADPQRARVAAESLPRRNAVFSGVVWTLMGVLFVPFAAMFEFVGYLVLNA